MPGPLDILKSLTAKYATPPLSPEEQAAQDTKATVAQQGDPSWMQTGRHVLDAGVGFLKGITGLGDQGPSGPSAINAGQVLGAALPLAGAMRAITPAEEAVTGLKGFYSRLNRAAELLPEGKSLNSQAAMNLMKKAPEGISQEEVGFRGLNDFLAGKPQVTKADVMQHLEANPPPQLKEKVLGTPSVPDLTDTSTPRNLPYMPETKFGKYTLPGGDDYRESLLTLPEADPSITDKDFQDWHYRHYGAQTDDTLADAQQFNPTVLEAYRQHRMAEAPDGTFRSSHWDDPNVLVHSRFNERELPLATPDDYTPPDRGRFLEEIQSDWHQTGKTQRLPVPTHS